MNWHELFDRDPTDDYLVAADWYDERGDEVLAAGLRHLHKIRWEPAWEHPMRFPYPGWTTRGNVWLPPHITSRLPRANREEASSGAFYFFSSRGDAVLVVARAAGEMVLGR